MSRPRIADLYSRPARLATPEEKAAFDAGLPHPDVQAKEAARAKRRAASVPGILKALAPGAAHLFTQYQRASQLSAAVQAARDATGARFTCSRELSLIDGTPIGVRVTRLE